MSVAVIPPGELYPDSAIAYRPICRDCGWCGPSSHFLETASANSRLHEESCSPQQALFPDSGRY